MSELDTGVVEGNEAPPDQDDAADSTISTGSEHENAKQGAELLRQSRAAKEANKAPERPPWSEVVGEPLRPEVGKVVKKEIDPLTVEEAARGVSDWRRQQEQELAELDQELAERQRAKPQPVIEEQPPVDPAEQAAKLDQMSVDEKRTLLAEQRRFLSAQAQEYAQQYAQAGVIVHNKLSSKAAEFLKVANSLGVQSKEDYERLRVTRPITFADLETLKAGMHADFAELNGLATERNTVLQQVADHESKIAEQQSAQWAKTQDKLFIEQHPEFADPKQARELQDGVARFLRSTGMNDDEMMAEWNRPNSPMRSSRGQAIIAMAAKNAMRLESASASKPLPKTLPPVLKPGMQQERPSQAASEIEKLTRQMGRASRQEQLRIGAKIAGLRREANSR